MYSISAVDAVTRHRRLEHETLSDLENITSPE